MTYVMLTVPRKYILPGRKWLEFMEKQDCHKWIIALEHGKNGLEHWQIRYKVRNCDTKEQKRAYLEQFKKILPEAHVEFSENWCDYEKKEGNYITSEDNEAVRKIRFGILRPVQREILHTANSQDDRQIDVWYDPRGNHGKSWLSIHLFERGLAFLVFSKTAEKASADICSGYTGQKYIIFDIPRSQKIPPDLYEQLERIKDGIVHDSRYANRDRNIRGAKIIVFTNQRLDTKRLSVDRWRLHGFSETGTKTTKKKGVV